MVDGSNESLYHADEELHPLVRTFSLSQTIFTNLDVLPPQKVSLTSEAYKCPKGLVCGLLIKWEPYFSSLFSLFSLHFLQWMAKILAFSFSFWLLQYISTAASRYIQQSILKFCSNFEKIKIFECGLLTKGCKILKVAQNDLKHILSKKKIFFPLKGQGLSL